MKYLKPFLAKETLLDTTILLICIFLVDIGLLMLVKSLFFDFNISKFYNSFFHFLYMLSKKFIYIFNLQCSTFLSQISILH